jgi:hypothetical protein
VRKLVESFGQRKNILSKEIEIESDSVRISFYDNGDIDGDSITVFLNKYPVLTHQPLSAKSLNMYLAFDKGKDVAEISMYAENLGRLDEAQQLALIQKIGKKLEMTELKQKIDAGEELVIVDLRHSMDFEADPHTIPGAFRIDASELEEHDERLPRDRDVILYCT